MKEDKILKPEIEQLLKIIGEITVENNFLKKKLPLLIFLLVKIFLYFFLFRKTIESRLDTKTLSLNFFLKKRFFFLLNKINVL